jgi:hypothetical protein
MERIDCRRIEEFPMIASKFHMLIEHLGLEDVPPSAYLLFGSAIRSLWSREASADINIAFLDAASYMEFAPRVRNRPRAAILAVPCTSASAILDGADFTVCQAVYHAGEFWFSSTFFEHLGQRLLVVNRVQKDSAFISLLRTFKYAQRGYGISYSEFMKIVDHLPTALTALDPAEAMRHSGGTVI